MRKKMNKQVLIDARKSRGWTQQQAADAIGCSRYSVVQYESGAVAANDSTIERIAKVYNLSVDDLLRPETYNLYALLLNVIERIESDDIAMIDDRALDDTGIEHVYFIVNMLLDYLARHYNELKP